MNDTSLKNEWVFSPSFGQRAGLCHLSPVRPTPSLTRFVASVHLHTQHAQVIVLAVKPDIIPQVLRELSQRVTRHHLIISIAAGATLQLMEHVSQGNPLFPMPFGALPPVVSVPPPVPG